MQHAVYVMKMDLLDDHDPDKIGQAIQNDINKQLDLYGFDDLSVDIELAFIDDED